MQLEHPHYQPLLRFVIFQLQLRTLNLVREQKDLTTVLKSLQKTISRLETDSALQEVKKVTGYLQKK